TQRRLISKCHLFFLLSGRHNPGGCARLADHHHLVGLGPLKVRFDEVVAAFFLYFVHDLYLPLLRTVQYPVVILGGDAAEQVATYGVDMAVDPEKALGSSSVQKGLNAAMQENAIKATITEANAILVMFEEGVHADLPVVRHWKHNQ